MTCGQHSFTLQRLATTLVVATCTMLAGCGDIVYTEYGVREGYAQTSVNGTRVLSGMFEGAGHRVRSWRHLSPALEKANVIVWCPDDFEPPTSEVEAWLTDWLYSGEWEGPPRVLIYVGRDFDAAPEYWQKVQNRPPPGLKQEYARRLSEAQGDAAAHQPAKLSRPATDDWFELDINPPQAKVKGLNGPWANGIDATKVDITREARLVPLGDDYRVLLSDKNNEPLVSERLYLDYNDSQPLGRLIMIENGSWLLNAQLVNPEHRKLAGKLIDSIGTESQLIVFLQSESGGPLVRESDPTGMPPTGFQLFRVWPLGAVLTQLAALGLVYAFMKWPIFGTPKRLRRHSLTDFSSHVAALGRLLRYGGSRTHAVNLLRMYRHAIRREASSEAMIAESTPQLPHPPLPTESPE